MVAISRHYGPLGSYGVEELVLWGCQSSLGLFAIYGVDRHEVQVPVVVQKGFNAPAWSVANLLTTNLASFGRGKVQAVEKPCAAGPRLAPEHADDRGVRTPFALTDPPWLRPISD